MGVPVTLKIYKGDELIATKEYDRDIIKIGRLTSAHLCLDDDKVSRIHSVIEVTPGGGLSIIDMGSIEGTYVNGQRVNKGAITAGDEIKVGNTTIRVELNHSASASSDPSSDQSAAAPSAAPPDDPEPAIVVTPLVEQIAAPEPEMAAPPPPPKEALSPRAPAPAPKPSPTPAVASKTPPSPKQQRHVGPGPLGLELRFMWGDQPVGEYFLKPGGAKSFTVGSAAGVDFVMGDSKLGTPKFAVVKVEHDNFNLRFTSDLTGELERGGGVTTVSQLIKTGQAHNEGDAYSLTLDSDDFAWIDLGGVTLEARFEPVPKPIVVPFFETIDFAALNVFLVLFFLGALFVITALNREIEGEDYKDELSSTQARIAKLIIKPPEIQKNPFLEKLARQKEDSGEIAAKHRGDEGMMGKKDAPKRNTRTAPKGDPNNKDQARMMAQKIFGPGSGGGISTIFGHNGLGGELKSAMGHMFGTAPGDAHGFGGLGLRGSGAGGGGVGDTIGIGGIGTKGRGGGTGSYGTGTGMLGSKKGTDIAITSSEPIVMGSLDKELIRQVIHRNRNQIRYCYESQLTRYPNLAGKVAVKFIISASGTVASSQVAQSTASNAELETCVASRVHTWIFPKPKGGGVVIVTYPFIFKPSGE